MATIVHIITDHWQIIIYLLTLAVGLAGTFLYVTKVKVPNIERKLNELEEKVEKIENGGVVRKGEIYEDGGGLRYVTEVHCGEIQATCQKITNMRFDQLCKKLDTVHKEQIQVRREMKETEEKRQVSSTVFYSFMAAAKEKFDLKFTIPNNHK